MMTVMVRGDVGAVKAATDSRAAAAKRVGDCFPSMSFPGPMKMLKRFSESTKGSISGEKK